MSASTNLTTPPQLFTLDTLLQILNRTILSSPGAIALLAYNLHFYLKTNGKSGSHSLVSLLVSLRKRENLSILLRNLKALLREKKWLAVLIVGVAMRSALEVLDRLAWNRGSWNADPPVWEKGPEEREGDVIVITGGSNGIGAELVDILSLHTNRIAVFDVAKPNYKAQNVKYYKVDVTDAGMIHEAAEKVRADIGQPTIIVNNAGMVHISSLLSLDSDNLLRLFKVNTISLLLMTKEFLPYMIKINHGHIQTITSAASYLSVPELGAYSCSKAASLAFCETLRDELVDRYNAPNIKTSVICPHKVSTAMGENLAESAIQFLSPTLTPHQVALVMSQAILSGRSSHHVLPALAEIAVPKLRAAPEWLRIGFIRAAQTSNLVDSSDRSLGIVASRRKYLARLLEDHEMK